MAVVTTHLLNSVLGTHAGGVAIGLLRSSRPEFVLSCSSEKPTPVDGSLRP